MRITQSHAALIFSNSLSRSLLALNSRGDQAPRKDRGSTGSTAECDQDVCILYAKSNQTGNTYFTIDSRKEDGRKAQWAGQWLADATESIHLPGQSGIAVSLLTSSDCSQTPSYPTNCLYFLQSRTNRAAAPANDALRLKIIVVGAGLGGLATAIALAQHGHSVTVYEQTPQLGEVWTYIDN